MSSACLSASDAAIVRAKSDVSGWGPRSGLELVFCGTGSGSELGLKGERLGSGSSARCTGPESATAHGAI